MRTLILSRKGTDSAFGGFPSPLLPGAGGVPDALSVPIPEAGTGVTYDAIAAPDGRPLLDVLHELGVTRIRSGGWRPLDHRVEAHLDPDLRRGARPRPQGWRPAFGQVGPASRHLDRHRVGVGDLFLFFGWFRAVHRTPAGLRWAGPAVGEHRLWGWLQVGAVAHPTVGSHIPGQQEHPHLRLPDRRHNVLYVAADRLTLDPGLPGAGLLRATPQTRLTAGDSPRRSWWRVPPALHPDATPAPLTYHADPARWHRAGDTVHLLSAPRGQEFVVGHTPALAAWVHALLVGSARGPSGAQRETGDTT